jgi:hypothetical protein
MDKKSGGTSNLEDETSLVAITAPTQDSDGLNSLKSH